MCFPDKLSHEKIRNFTKFLFLNFLFKTIALRIMGFDFYLLLNVKIKFRRANDRLILLTGRIFVDIFTERASQSRQKTKRNDAEQYSAIFY